MQAYVPPDMSTSRVDVHGDPVHYWLLLGHIGFGAIATVAGLAQFWSALRRKYPTLHRWTGRVYFFAGVFPSALLAIPVATMSPTGVSNIAALFTLIALWLATGVAGLRAARARRYADHRKWMIRNYAVTLAGLASRPWAGITVTVIFALENSAMYRGNETAMIHDMASAASWLAIVVNMVIAEIYIQRKYGGGNRKPARVNPAREPVTQSASRAEPSPALSDPRQ
jgi:hypothetical protein